MLRPPDVAAQLRGLLGPAAVLTSGPEFDASLTDHRRLRTGRAAALVLPDTVDQVRRTLAFCHEWRVPVVPHGGNTSYCGGATPDASGHSVVLALRRLNRIRQVDAANNALVAEAGCVLAEVQAAAAGADRLFPLSLGSEGSCQIGGNLATNAGGTAVLRYGMARDLTLGIEAVFADGSLYSRLSPLRKDNAGYDLRHLLVGSEGTLAVITAACLKLFPVQRSSATALVAVPSPDAALAVLERLRAEAGERVSGCELLPLAALQLTLRAVPGVRDPRLAEAAWYVLVELTSAGEEPLDAMLADALARSSADGQVTDAVLARGNADAQALWHLRESVPEAQRRAGASLKHDVSVPPGRIPELIARGGELAARLVPEGFLVAYGHAGDGNLHFNVSQRTGADTAAFQARGPALQRAMHDLVATLGGSFSAEHGIGQLKTAELARYAPPAGLAAMRAIKQALDPRGILNPGKLFGEVP